MTPLQTQAPAVLDSIEAGLTKVAEMFCVSPFLTDLMKKQVERNRDVGDDQYVLSALLDIVPLMAEMEVIFQLRPDNSPLYFVLTRCRLNSESDGTGPKEHQALIRLAHGLGCQSLEHRVHGKREPRVMTTEVSLVMDGPELGINLGHQANFLLSYMCIRGKTDTWPPK